MTLKDEMTTFSEQDKLPSLPLPDLNDTLDKYLQSASIGLTPSQLQNTQKCVEEFRTSPLVQELHAKLVERSKNERNWLEDWWMDAYMEIREPLVPYVSFGSKNPNFLKVEGSQSRKAADIIYQWMLFWKAVRREEIPVFKSRGIVWDMAQYHYLFNSNRTPAMPKDHMMRCFKTEKEGSSPTHLIVLCRGNVWRVNGIRDNDAISANEMYHVMEYILKHSKEQEHSLISLTTAHRDIWAQIRTNIVARSEKNTRNMKEIEESLMCLTMDDKVIDDWKELTFASGLGSSRNQWADKSVNMCIYKDGQCSVLAEHSNLDAIVVIHADEHCSGRIRNDLWAVEPSTFEIPVLLEFEFTDDHLKAMAEADRAFNHQKSLINFEVVDYKGFGNDLLKKNKIYADTALQIAIQLAYAKVHGRFAPIYETASTRKFYHGRTETVRGRSQEMVAFGNSVFEGRTLNEQRKLFKAAYDSHNQQMAACMNGMGVDRHLFGLRKMLAEINSKRGLPIPEPSLYSDEAWRLSGGGGQFLLSTSFVGYMSDTPRSMFGKFCSAMCANGYGTYYQIAPNRLMFNITDYRNTESDLQAYGRGIVWALEHIRSLLEESPATAKL